MTPPIFTFTRVTGTHGGLTLRSAAVSVASALGAAACLLLYRFMRRPDGAMPERHPDRRLSLSDEERAAWQAFEGAALKDIGLAILSDQEDPS